MGTAWQQLVGNSAVMAQLRQHILKAASTTSNVLVEGESGTGKELVARALHANSARAEGPLVTVNCGALPEPLLESEMFGHERGSFTGAVKQQKGKFEQASGGTLFLDEIGEMGLSTQTKLLRVLEDRKLDRIGGERPIPIDIRVIAATNRDLRAAVSAGEFRQDLYYRLKVLPIKTPPLREHREDIPALVHHFILKNFQEGGRRLYDISDEVEAILMKYEWPGNVRELQNVIQHAIAFGSADLVIESDLPRELLESVKPSGMGSYYEAVYDFKRRLFTDALCRARGDYKIAAQLLDLHEKCMHRFLKSLKLTHLLKKGPAF
ncbi:MAG TPA: sigma-54 dependent transcriptional regulator [Terriglobia bacterium]|nr:sigma-54 dependent transcriptional regulator [Terriglobia bacterium]